MRFPLPCRLEVVLMSKKALTKALRAEVDKSDLNEHHKLFCLYYVQNHNATQAYVNAWKKVAEAHGGTLG